MTASGPTFEEISETFELMDDWDARYEYLIELGKGLSPLSDAQKTAATKVEGCVSQVWLWPNATDEGGVRRLFFEGDSDALIVRGLIAVLRALLSGRPTSEIAAADPKAALAKLGLDQALSPQRSNGLSAMIRRVQELASAS